MKVWRFTAWTPGGGTLSPAGPPGPECVRPRVARPVGVSIPVLPLILVVLLVPLLALLALAGKRALAAGEPDQLAQAALTGPRQLLGSACLVIASDVSGSMQEIAGVRETAVAGLFEFLRRELQPNDRLALISYAEQAIITLPSTAVSDLPSQVTEQTAPDGNFTYLLPALEAAEVGLEPGCAAKITVTVTDGELADSASGVARQLTSSGAARLTVLVPNGKGRPALFKDASLAGVEVDSFPERDADELGLRYGKLLADMLGQELAIQD